MPTTACIQVNELVHWRVSTSRNELDGKAYVRMAAYRIRMSPACVIVEVQFDHRRDLVA